MADFDPIEYIENMAEANKLCKGLQFATVFASGPDNIEGIMADYRKVENFIVIDDTTDNHVHANGSGFFTKSVYTVWILAGYKYNDSNDRKKKMNLCRTIFKQFLSKMVSDKARMVYGRGMYYMNIENIYYHELGRYSFNGATGLYFMVENDVPTNLVFNADEWENV